MSTHAQGEVSRELDELSCDLLASALDRLAAGDDVNVLLAVQNAQGSVTPYEFTDDGAEACLEGARDQVRDLGSAIVRYALAYEASVDADGSGEYHEALILEFGERGWPAYSAFSLYEGKGTGERFMWTDPAPAGEVEALLD